MATSNSKAESIGRWLGQTWQRLIRQDTRVARWMINRSTSPLVANLLLWIMRLAVFAVFLYVAFWLAIVIVIAVIATALFQSGGRHRQHQKWFAEGADHRDELFYHPLTYNDDPDPRFHDPRFQDK